MSAEQTNLLVNRPTLVTPTPQLRIAGMEETLEAALEAKLDRFKELQPLVAEFNKLRKELAEVFQGERHVTVGRRTILLNTHEVPEKAVRGHSRTQLNVI